MAFAAWMARGNEIGGLSLRSYSLVSGADEGGRIIIVESRCLSQLM